MRDKPQTFQKWRALSLEPNLTVHLWLENEQRHVHKGANNKVNRRETWQCRCGAPISIFEQYKKHMATSG